MNIEGQDSIFGQENSVTTAQSSSQPQLSESDNKVDDSIDNQQQVIMASGLLSKLSIILHLMWVLYTFISVNEYFVLGLVLALLQYLCINPVFSRTWIWMRALMEWRRRSLR